MVLFHLDMTHWYFSMNSWTRSPHTCHCYLTSFSRIEDWSSSGHWIWSKKSPERNTSNVDQPSKYWWSMGNRYSSILGPRWTWRMCLASWCDYERPINVPRYSTTKPWIPRRWVTSLDWYEIGNQVWCRTLPTWCKSITLPVDHTTTSRNTQYFLGSWWRVRSWVRPKISKWNVQMSYFQPTCSETYN